MKNTYRQLQNSHLRAAAVVGILTVWCCSATAAPVFFTDRAAFDAATGGALDLESFEGTWSSLPTLNFNGFSASETTGVNYLYQARGYSGVSSCITDGTGALWYQDNGSSTATFFSFTSPVNAFGLDITAIGANSTVTIGGSVNDSLSLTMETPRFWGVVSTTGLDTITFDASGTPYIGFDAASYGVPEPAALALLALGFPALLRRRGAVGHK